MCIMHMHIAVQDCGTRYETEQIWWLVLLSSVNHHWYVVKLVRHEDVLKLKPSLSVSTAGQISITPYWSISTAIQANKQQSKERLTCSLWRSTDSKKSWRLSSSSALVSSVSAPMSATHLADMHFFSCTWDKLIQFWCNFYRATAMLSAVYAVVVCLSVCVCVSVTLRYCIKTAKRRITQIPPHQSSLQNSKGITPYGATNAGGVN